jgi:hypothetical protein
VTCQRLHDADDRTAVGFHKRRILLSQHYSKQNISGVPGFEHGTGKLQQQFGHEVRKLGL